MYVRDRVLCIYHDLPRGLGRYRTLGCQLAHGHDRDQIDRLEGDAVRARQSHRMWNCRGDIYPI